MLTIIVALTVCSALALAFKESRGLGIAGVAALIFLAPLVFGSLLLVAGLAYYVLCRWSRSELIPRGNLLPPDAASRRRRGVGLLVLATGAAGVLAAAYGPVGDGVFHTTAQDRTRSAAADEVIVLRTPGGLLQTATIEAAEVLDAKFVHRILGVKIGEVAPRIRTRAHYAYHVRLDPEWRVIRRGGVITALAPSLTPSLPVAIDTATLEKSVAGTWLIVPFTGDEDLEALERTITAKLARKASSNVYKERALEQSRRTVAEFVKNWASQSGQSGVSSVRVVFEGETIRSIETIAG